MSTATLTPVAIAKADPHLDRGLLWSRSKELSEVGHVVADLVQALETAVHVGSYARILTLMFHKPPMATQPERLLDAMVSNENGGWSCWDVSVALVELLRRRGIDAGVTATFGAELTAPSEPHALVRVQDGDRTLLADPYFGIGALEFANPRWHSRTSYARLTTNPMLGGTERIYLEHRSYTRTYEYNVLPGVLNPAQLTAMTWQALHYGDWTRHLRGAGNGTGWRLIRRTQDCAELRTVALNGVSGVAPTVVEGDLFELRHMLVADRAVERERALKVLFG